MHFSTSKCLITVPVIFMNKIKILISKLNLTFVLSLFLKNKTAQMCLVDYEMEFVFLQCLCTQLLPAKSVLQL